MEKIHSFILLGKTGDGKSSLAKFLSETNKINKFEICDGKSSGTTNIDDETFSFGNDNYKVIDTPGFFDSNGKEIKNNDIKIINSIKDSKSPISTILIVVNFQMSRIDEPTQVCIQKISELFPMENFWEHVIIIFTKYYPDPDDPENFEVQKKNWEKDIDIFKKRINPKLINNNNKIKVFYINNSKKNMKNGKNSNIRRDILNCIKNTNLFYSSKRIIEIPKERINLSTSKKEDEPDEKYGNIEIRRYRSIRKIIYLLPNNMISEGPTIEIKSWTEKIEYFDKYEGLTKIKMKHFYIDNEFKGDYCESFEFLDINKIDHWEISCKCGFKDKTKYAHSKTINVKAGKAGAFTGGAIGGLIIGLISGPIGWGALIAASAGAGLVGGLGLGFGASKISEKITQSKNIGLDTFKKGCPNCGKIELDVIPKFKD